MMSEPLRKLLTLRPGITTKPYARLRSTNRRYKKPDGSYGHRNTSVDLCFNSGAMREYSLQRGAMVDILYERYNTEWKMPILIVRKGGSQRKLTGTIHQTNYLTVGIGAAVKQFDLPLLLGKRLDIVDFIDGDLYIDITNASGALSLEEEQAEKKKRKEVMKRMLSYTTGERSSGHTFRASTTLRNRVIAAAKREGKPANQLIINALEIYLEENHYGE